MAFNFPDSPVEGQQFIAPAGPVYQYTDGKWTLMGGSAAPAPLSSFRNRIINGDFQIDQRNSFAAKLVNANNVFGPDRWKGSAGGGGAFYLAAYQAQGQMNTSCQAVDASLAAGDIYYFGQAIEGYNIRDLLWGTANAKPITISFEAYCSSATGPFTVSVRNGGAARSWLGTFSFSAASTWEQKTFTIPGDTTGTWDTDNSTGIQVFICLASGATYGSGVAGWQAGNFVGVTGQVNFMTSTSNGLNIRNFQLEVGTVVTEFERVPYDQQLARCRRYYQAHTWDWRGAFQQGGGGHGGAFVLPVMMRANPTCVGTQTGNSGAFTATPNSSVLNPGNILIYRASVAGSAVGVGSATDNYTFTAEL